MADTGTKKLEAKCHCGSVHFTVDIALSKLPLPVHLCHCSLCRYRSGAPCVFHTAIPREAIEWVAPSFEQNMEVYEADDIPSGWGFCSTCGCHVGSLVPDGPLVVSTSIFVDHSQENFYIKKHIYSKSAKDGSIASMLGHIGGREVEDINPPEGREDGELVEQEPEYDSSGVQRLRAKCYCGGVSFTLGSPEEKHKQDDYHKNYVSPIDSTKWMGCLDICNDCRLVNGTHVIGWTFVPVDALDPPIKRDLMIGTSKTYASSEGVLRSFCGTCGATVFFSCKERTPTEEKMVVDIATGILRAPEGSMAENWLTWRTKIANADCGIAFDKEHSEALIEGAKRWTVERNGNELNFAIE